MANKNDRYESCEICKSAGVNLANENVYLIMEADSHKGYRISIISDNPPGKIIREVRLSGRGKLESYFDSSFGEDI